MANPLYHIITDLSITEKQLRLLFLAVLPLNIEDSRQKIAATVNTTILHTYWQIGKIIVEDEALHIGDDEYEKQSLRQLSKVLTTDFGKGFSRSNLSNMRQFYLSHKDVQTASGQLSFWKLLSESN